MFCVVNIHINVLILHTIKLNMTMNKKITILSLATITGGKIIGKKHIEDKIEYILYDSRRLNGVDNVAFFAIQTANNDGNRYINDLYNKGVRMFITSKEQIIIHKDATYLIVKDVIDCLQLLSREYRTKFYIPTVVAITGSNGKTIVKDWIVKLVDNDKKVCSTIKSYNSQIGVPLCVYNIKDDTELAIFEAGISMPNEMQKLERIILPNIGLFTNIGDQHGCNFSSIDDKIEEKLQLFIHCKKIVFHDNNPRLSKHIRLFADKYNIDLVAWGDKPLLPLNSTDVYYLQKDLLSQVSLPFTDKASIENALSSFVLCLTIGIQKNHLLQRLRTLQQLDSRFEIKSGINNCLIINDSYSCDMSSLEIALDYLNTQNKQHKQVILTDVKQTTTNTEQLYSDINQLLINKHIDSIIAIGENFYTNQDKITIKNKHFYLTVEDFVTNLKRKDFINKAILIKGASSMHTERISNQLSNLTHQTVEEINLTALEENVSYYHTLIKKDTLVMAMVKANAYGSGSVEIASALERKDLVDYFAVAFTDEGVSLRREGIKKPIMVITPEKDSEFLLQQYNLEPVIHSFEVLNNFVTMDLNVHIKLDTGMHRLGFGAKDLNNLITILQQSKLHIKSVFSHLYGADDSLLDKYTNQQIELFNSMSSFICSCFDYKILRHLSNSAATYRFSNANYDMVRLGIGMYGIGVDSNEEKHLRKVHKLRTTITQIREIDKGEDVSYCRGFVSQYKMRIGVIPIGYADGLNRHLGNEHFKVYVNGEYCNIIGNICMDMCMIDLTTVKAKVGDMVIVFGTENSIEDMALACQTIPYEILTSISNRIPRIYYHE